MDAIEREIYSHGSEEDQANFEYIANGIALDPASLPKSLAPPRPVLSLPPPSPLTRIPAPVFRSLSLPCHSESRVPLPPQHCALPYSPLHSPP
eukprot:248098-Rhodomonas_salina.1